jgi:hypothetical protein
MGDPQITLTITLGPHVGEDMALRSKRVDDQQGAPGGVDPRNPLGTCSTLRVSKESRSPTTSGLDPRRRPRRQVSCDDCAVW